MHERRSSQNIIRKQDGYVYQNFAFYSFCKNCDREKEKGLAHIFIGTTKMIAVAVLLFACEYIIFNT